MSNAYFGTRCPGQYDFDGAWAPDPMAAGNRWNETFSLGVFQVQQKRGGRGLKRGPVLVRVKGYVGDRIAVFTKARMIAQQLEEGVPLSQFKKTVFVRGVAATKAQEAS